MSFNGLHSRRHDAEVEFYAFDILVSDGEDFRRLPRTFARTIIEAHNGQIWAVASGQRTAQGLALSGR